MEHEAFVASFQGPTVLYRALKDRSVHAPVFLPRNLSYRESRFKRYRQLGHKVSAQLTTPAGTPMPQASASLPNARTYHCRFLRVRLDLCKAVLSSDSVLVVTMVAENNGADSNSGDKPSYHIIDAPQVVHKAGASECHFVTFDVSALPEVARLPLVGREKEERGEEDTVPSPVPPLASKSRKGVGRKKQQSQPSAIVAPPKRADEDGERASTGGESSEVFLVVQLFDLGKAPAATTAEVLLSSSDSGGREVSGEVRDAVTNLPNSTSSSLSTLSATPDHRLQAWMLRRSLLENLALPALIYQAPCIGAYPTTGTAPKSTTNPPSLSSATESAAASSLSAPDGYTGGVSSSSSSSSS
eukprot:CAMPEP_0171959438 /NCGR_PEP_ID=MMETSP0993-20121228/147949_1 /TAXON_ID=483369 /ORGANISM="non described non described, Strain CCMP2098" /LENGTH=356 /DNA_ID=CAMNT_0012606949 /DNA_START=31 /DNA_END=1097 /DNA_ORIENTATION=-